MSGDETSRRTTEEEGEEALTESHAFIVFAETRGKVINHLLMMMETMVKSSTDDDVIVAELPAVSSLLCLCWRCVRFGGVSSGAVADGGVSVVSLSQERNTSRPNTCWETGTPECAWRPDSANTTSTMAALCSTAQIQREYPVTRCSTRWPSSPRTRRRHFVSKVPTKTTDHL